MLRGYQAKPAAATLLQVVLTVLLFAFPQLVMEARGYETQTRSKTSRVLADLRSVKTAIEAYAVDNNAYPIPGVSPGWNEYFEEATDQPFSLPTQLTTPVAYLAALPTDPFQRNWQDAGSPRALYIYLTSDYLESIVNSRNKDLSFAEASGWTLHVPDLMAVEAFEFHFGEYVAWSCGPQGPDQWRRGVPFFLAYDPTNGEWSPGHIFITQKNSHRTYVPLKDFPAKFPFLEAGTLPPITAWERMRERLVMWLVGAACLMIPFVIVWLIARSVRRNMPPSVEGELR